MAKNDVKVLTFVIADQVIESVDKKKSIIGIFDRLFVKNLPANHPNMSLFSTLLSSPGESDEVSIIVESPSGKQESKIDLKFTYGNNGKADLVVNIQAFPIKEIGEYKFSLIRKDQTLAEYIIHVTQIKEQNSGESIVN